MIKKYNACDRHRDRITAGLWAKITSAYEALKLPGALDVLVLFVDFDRHYRSHPTCWHEYGKDGSVVLVEVGPPIITPHIMLFWMACHELRHAYQSVQGMYSDPLHTEAFERLLRSEGLRVASAEFMEKYHDQFPEEVDADTWANTFTKFNGTKWWDKVVVGGQRGLKVANYKI